MLRHHSADPGTNSFDGSIEILSTFNRADMAIIKSVLSGNRIDYIITGGNMHYEPMWVLMKVDQVKRTPEILKGVKLNFSQITFV